MKPSSSGRSEIIRYVNDARSTVYPRFFLEDEPVEWMCECEDNDCKSIVKMTVCEYDRIRRSGRHVLAHR